MSLPKEISELYPFKQNDFASSGGRMNFVDEGLGEKGTVVLLHGNPTWSFMWREVIKALVAKGFRCIAPDHLGMGLSEKPHRYFSLADRIAHVEELISHLGLEKFSLCVHDWGGAIGCGVAGNSPEKVLKLVVMNTAAFRSRNIPKRIAICKMFGIGPALVKYFNAFVRPATRMCVSKKLPSAVKKGFLFPYKTPRDREAVANFVRDIPMTPSHRSYDTLCKVEANLEKLRTKPMLLAWGGKDFCFGNDFYAEWKERFPDAQTLYCDDARHYLLEDAGEKIIPEIARFLLECKSKFSRRAMIRGRLCSQEHKSVGRTPDGSEARQGFTPKGVRATDCSLENNLPWIAS